MMVSQDYVQKRAKKDSIELSLPINAAYVSAARLTASTIANRMRFDTDEIEDVKAAVSEACAYIISRARRSDNEMFKIVFDVSGGILSVKLLFHPARALDKSREDMGLIMMKALTDGVEIRSASEKTAVLEITKVHKHRIF